MSSFAHEPQEYAFRCPCCGEAISVLLDMSVAAQEYVEDCEVCCRPLVIRFTSEEGRLREFRAEAEAG